MARQRNKENRGLPKRWRWNDGSIRYLVPKGQENHWDGKREFRLGKTLAEAHRTFGGRIASFDGAIVTFGQLLDRYVFEVTPSKSKRTQKDEIAYIQKLRKLIGANSVIDFRPQHAYQVRDHLKNNVTKGSGEKQANRHMSVLKHVFTKAIEWGTIDVHPMHSGAFKMFPEKRSKMRIPSDAEVREAIKIANPMLQSYCKLKLITGLRQTDLLGLTVHNVKDDYLEVMLSKTEDRTEQVLRFDLTDEMRDIIRECRERKPLSKHLFKTRDGECQLKEDNTCTGFESQWQRWQRKLPKEQRFSERSIRNLVGSQDGLEIASERLGHASSATTKKFYRSNVTNVAPLIPNRKSENS
jgi:integrase